MLLIHGDKITILSLLAEGIKTLKNSPQSHRTFLSSLSLQRHESHHSRRPTEHRKTAISKLAITTVEGSEP